MLFMLSFTSCPNSLRTTTEAQKPLNRNRNLFKALENFSLTSEGNQTRQSPPLIYGIIFVLEVLMLLLTFSWKLVFFLISDRFSNLARKIPFPPWKILMIKLPQKISFQQKIIRLENTPPPKKSREKLPYIFQQ